MHEQKIVLLGLFVVIYLLYSAHVWFNKDTNYYDTVENKSTTQESIEIPPNVIQDADVVSAEKLEEKQENSTAKNETKEVKPKIIIKTIPLFFKNACSILQIFTEKPPMKIEQPKPKATEPEQSTITEVAIMIFLGILLINAILDVIKVKEEERAKRLANPNGERRQSLAEFANKKPLRRESSRFGFQLFQIAEASTKSEEDASERKTRPVYTRGQSINSYLSEKNASSDGSASMEEPASSEPKLVKRQSVAKLFGARPVPMVRRSSFPALPINPDIQATMLSSKQTSFDSDDEGDGRGRRVRIIRRY